MAGFKTHITVSTALGAAYGAAGFYFADMPPSESLPVSLLAFGLCSVSGMLPDLDSGPGVPLRESLAFAAAAVPMLMVPRWKALQFTPETMVLAGCFIYLLIRFGLGWALKKYTVHRGMFHSIPAAVIAAEVAFLVYSREDIFLRYYVAFAVAAGFCSHLVLDEIWSVGVKRGQIALKKSFGTACKFWSKSTWANISCYGKLIVLSYLVLHDPVWMYNDESPTESMRVIAQRFIDRVRGNGKSDAEEELPPLRAIPRSQFQDERESPAYEQRPEPRFNDRDDRNEYWQDRDAAAQRSTAARPRLPIRR